MAQKQKAVVLFSGGVDSTTCLALAIERFGKDNVVPLSIQYGQKHSKELEAATVWKVKRWMLLSYLPLVTALY